MSRKKINRQSNRQEKLSELVLSGKIKSSKDELAKLNSTSARIIRIKQIERQQRFLRHFAEAMNLNVAMACRMSGIGRYAVYKWMRTDPKFARQFLMIEESIKDHVEMKLMEKINSGDRECTMFFLRTKARDRGYAEKQSIDVEVTERIPQERIDAIVKAHERIIKDNYHIPDQIIKHLEHAKMMEKKRLLPEECQQDIIDIEVTHAER